MENIPLVTSPWPQNIESLLSKVWWWWSGGNLKGDGSFDERGLKIEAVDWNEAIEAVAGDLILASRFSWRLTAVVGSGLLNKKTSSWNFRIFRQFFLLQIFFTDFFYGFFYDFFTNIFTNFLRMFLTNVIDELFLTNCFWWIFLTIFDDFFLMKFLTNILTNFFDEFFDEFFWRNFLDKSFDEFFIF